MTNRPVSAVVAALYFVIAAVRVARGDFFHAWEATLIMTVYALVGGGILVPRPTAEGCR